MKIFINYSIILSLCLFFYRVNSNPVDLSPNFLFGSLKNVTLGATSFIADSLQKQTDIIIHAKDVAKDYVSHAVAVPKNLLINAKDATRDYVDNAASKGMEIKVKALIEVFRANMPYGVSALDLPILEPYKIDHMDIDVDHKEIGNLSSTIDNVTISQLSTFVVDRVKLSLSDGIGLALNLSVPTIKAEGMYKVSGKLGKLFSVNGSGPFDIEIHQVKVYVNTILGYSTSMRVKNLTLDFSVKSLNAVFHHLFPDPEVEKTVNEVISMMAPEIMDVVKPDVRPMLEEMITERINRIVGRLTMGHILSILTGTTDINSLSNLTTTKLSIN